MVGVSPHFTKVRESLREMCSDTEFFLVRIFLHSVQIKTPYWETFHAVGLMTTFLMVF